MPAVSQARTPCIAQLAVELGFASKPTLLRHLARIDELAPQIDPDGIYPEDWIVFRITGYRPEIESPALVPGDALRGDLSAIAEKISESAGITAEDIDHPFETIDSLTQRWSVSRKTIERYRRLGLIARRLDLGKGRRSVIFMREAVEWFESLNTKRLGKAARFDRISDSQIERIERWSRGYRSRMGWSRSQAAARIAMRTGHSHEGVRKVLIRIDRESEEPIFTDPGPTTSRDQMLALRCVLRGIEPAQIAERSGRSHNAVLRAINSARAGLIESFDLPTGGDAEQGGESVLESPAVDRDLNTRGVSDLCALIETMRVREPTVVYEEQMRVRAFYHLMTRAGARLATIDRATPSGPALDAIETDLRLGGMLKIELVRAQLSLALSTIEHKIGGMIDSLDPSRASFLLLGAIRVAGDAIDRFDPSHHPSNVGRIAAPVGLAITRFASQQPDIAQPVSAGKAMRRIPPGHFVEDWTRMINPWQRWLMPDARIESVVDKLGERDRLILVRRYGLDGKIPVSREDLAGMLGTSAMHCARFERVAIRNALRVARGGEL